MIQVQHSVPKSVRDTVVEEGQSDPLTDADGTPAEQ